MSLSSIKYNIVNFHYYVVIRMVKFINHTLMERESNNDARLYIGITNNNAVKCCHILTTRAGKVITSTLSTIASLWDVNTY